MEEILKHACLTHAGNMEVSVSLKKTCKDPYKGFLL